MERFLTRLLGLFFILTGPLNAFFNIVPLSSNFINMNNVDGDAKPWPSNECAEFVTRQRNYRRIKIIRKHKC